MPRTHRDSDSSSVSEVSSNNGRDKSNSPGPRASRNRSNSGSGSDNSRSPSPENKRDSSVDSERDSGDNAEPVNIPRVAQDQPRPPQVKLSPLEMVSPHLPREARPTTDVGEMGLDRWKLARDTHVKDSSPVFGATVLGDPQRRFFQPRRLGSSLRGCLSKDRRSKEHMFESFERMAHSAVIGPMAYFGAAARKRAQIEECRNSGQPIPEGLRKLEFDTETFCNDMDATITLQGGLVNRIQYRRVENILGGIHHTIRPESTVQALSQKDEVGTGAKAYLFGHSRSNNWADQEKKRRWSRDLKAKPKSHNTQYSQSNSRNQQFSGRGPSTSGRGNNHNNSRGGYSGRGKKRQSSQTSSKFHRKRGRETKDSGSE